MSSLFLTINRFKCFEKFDLRIENLTLLTGKNGVGKSSITQSIRLLRKAAIAKEKIVQFHLNDIDFQLGTYDEIFNRNSVGSGDKIEIGISNKSKKIPLIAFGPAESLEECEYVEVAPRKIPVLEKPSSLFFTYLSAERYGPRILQEKTDGHRSVNVVGVGAKGEFSAEALVINQTTRIDGRLVHPSLAASSNALLISNLEKWMSMIVGEIEIRASRPPRLANPMLEFRKSGAEAEWQFPTNHGFGVSYTLPIVLAGLLLEENGFLIVDSPEAHLHPAAQTALANFLALIAACGRTVIVETHSDHIVDGFRLAIASPSHPLNANDCAFHYLDQSENGSIIHHDLTPRPNGTLPKWPKGFFDQVSTNLRALSQFAKRE